MALASKVDIKVDTFSQLQKHLVSRFENIDERDVALAVSCITKTGFSEFGASQEGADCVAFAIKYTTTVLEALKPKKESKMNKLFKHLG